MVGTIVRRLISRLATEKQERALRARVRELRRSWNRRFRSYGPAQLEAELRRAGIESGDTLLVHANFRPDSGFEGTPNDLVTVFLQLVGPDGNLLMVSQPFRGYAADLLEQGKVFDVRKSVSMMGLVTEMFRRRPGTLRSLHPTHPVLASGKDAAEVVSGHEHCLYPCGAGTPFDWFRHRNGKILFFDVSSGANTFFHHVEDRVKDELGFRLYDPRLFTATVRDTDGTERQVRTYAFARGVKRRTDMLEEALVESGRLRRGRVGNSTFLLGRASDIEAAILEFIRSGRTLIVPSAEQEA